MKKTIATLVLLFTLLSGCVTIGSKDTKMIRTVSDILVTSGEMTEADQEIILDILDRVEEE